MTDWENFEPAHYKKDIEHIGEKNIKKFFIYVDHTIRQDLDQNNQANIEFKNVYKKAFFDNESPASYVQNIFKQDNTKLDKQVHHDEFMPKLQAAVGKAVFFAGTKIRKALTDEGVAPADMEEKINAFKEKFMEVAEGCWKTRHSDRRIQSHIKQEEIKSVVSPAKTEAKAAS